VRFPFGFGSHERSRQEGTGNGRRVALNSCSTRPRFG
jgi:hypothetical protein